jgi:hypothetical protein
MMIRRPQPRAGVFRACQLFRQQARKTAIHDPQWYPKTVSILMRVGAGHLTTNGGLENQHFSEGVTGFFTMQT